MLHQLHTITHLYCTRQHYWVGMGPWRMSPSTLPCSPKHHGTFPPSLASACKQVLQRQDNNRADRHCVCFTPPGRRRLRLPCVRAGTGRADRADADDPDQRYAPAPASLAPCVASTFQLALGVGGGITSTRWCRRVRLQCSVRVQQRAGVVAVVVVDGCGGGQGVSSVSEVVTLRASGFARCLYPFC